MPTYGYRCERCLTAFELLASIAEYEAGLELECPNCGSERVRRTITTVNILGGSRTGAPPSGGCCGDSGGSTGCCG